MEDLAFKGDIFAPKLSIGLAVFNGAGYLREAIDSILKQSFQDFELILCDNASTDSTPMICKEYADRDNRVRYVRNSRNIGLSPNLNKVFGLASGEYFKWAAHDDLISIDYLQGCIKVLEANSDIVLCQARVANIDTHGSLVCKTKPQESQASALRIEKGLSSGRVYDRLVSLQNDPSGWLQVYGVIRRSSLLNTNLFGGYPEDDHVLLTQLALQGRIYTDTENTFFSRDHAGQSVAIGRRSMSLFAIWLNPEKKGRLILPQWELVFTYVQALVSSPQTDSSKAPLLLAAILFIGKKLPRLLKDLCVGLLQILDYSWRKLMDPIISVDSGTLIFGRYPRIKL